MKLVYLSGPITGSGDRMQNARKAIDAADELMRLGYAVICPNLNDFWQLVYQHEYEEWLAMDFEYVRRCDAVLRLPGDSSGADREVAFAKGAGIPVYYSVEELDMRMGMFNLGHTIHIPHYEHLGVKAHG